MEQKKRVIIHINNVTQEVLEAIQQKYPEGYQDRIFKVTKPNGDFFHAITVDTADASYLIKVDVKIDTATDEKIEEHHHFIKNLTKLRENRTAPVLVRFLKFKHTGGTPLHDRFIFSNSWAIQMGNGLDVVGFKDVSISFIDNHREYQRNFFDKYWDMKYLKTEIREKQVIGYDV